MDSVNAVRLPSEDSEEEKTSLKSKPSPNFFKFPLLLIVFMFFFVSGWSIGGIEKYWRQLPGQMPEIYVEDYTWEGKTACAWSGWDPGSNWDKIPPYNLYKAYVYDGSNVWHYGCTQNHATGGWSCSHRYKKSVSSLFSDLSGTLSPDFPTGTLDATDGYYVPEERFVKAYTYKGDRVWHHKCYKGAGEAFTCNPVYTKTLSSLWSSLGTVTPAYPTSGVDAVASYYVPELKQLKTYVYKGNEYWYYKCIRGGGDNWSCSHVAHGNLSNLTKAFPGQDYPIDSYDAVDLLYIPEGKYLQAVVIKDSKLWKYRCNRGAGDSWSCHHLYSTPLSSTSAFGSFTGAGYPPANIDAFSGFYIVDGAPNNNLCFPGYPGIGSIIGVWDGSRDGWQRPSMYKINGFASWWPDVHRGSDGWDRECGFTQGSCPAGYVGIQAVAPTLFSECGLKPRLLTCKKIINVVCTAGQTGTQACSITNGTGSQTRTCTTSGSWGSWGSCTLASCNSGFHKSGSSCVANTCTGTTPASSTICSGDGSGITGNSNLARQLVSSCTSRKCEYTCNSGFHKSGSSCVANQCTGSQGRCLDGRPQLCQNYIWVNQTACPSWQSCQPPSVACTNKDTYCEPNGKKTCSNGIPQLCASNEWVAQTACPSWQTCQPVDGSCADKPDYCPTNDALRCSNGSPQKCVQHLWVNQTACTSWQECSDGVCVNQSGYCPTNDVKRCLDGMPQECQSHLWTDLTACEDDKECRDGECVSTSTSLNLIVDLEVKDDDTSDEIKIQLKQDGEVKAEETVSVGSDGRKDEVQFSVSPGDYKVVVKPKGYLSRAKTVSLSNTAVDVSFAVFLAGDLNETSYNLINSLDYSIFKNHFKTDDRVTDFNGDGQVNTLDYSIFVRNFNKTGEE